ncbi:carbohydrate ABC transporter permease [Deinococcus roseus]|uniref:ABC transporter permease n=1 Tax=Deinococcus roseus TaxID=392414 RepID=A0ABQ2DGU7_9DEIO|nr:carbohydrate ABC transporter permease [Deinococcus roseus]GGJ54403.1 ABC transporter permease [Deinococcus roseus]
MTLKSHTSSGRSLPTFKRTLFYLMLAAITAYLLFPFVWAVITSFRHATDLFLPPMKFLLAKWTIKNYIEVLGYPSFSRGFLMSVLVATGSVAVSLLLGAFASYALGRFRFKGKSVILYVILSVTIFPQIAVLSGLFTLIQQFGLYNNPLGLIFSYLISSIPFSVWVLTSFVREIPSELEEAAMVDGATPLQTLFRVLLPVMVPALVTTGLLSFIAVWNEYLFALTFTSDNRTVPVVIANFSAASQFELPWANIMAGSMLVTVPLIVLVMVFQKNIISGLTSGAVKG